MVRHSRRAERLEHSDLECDLEHSRAGGGTGWNGTLGSSSYALVFQSDPARTSGHVDLAWTLAAPGSGIRAGNHQLTIRWKLESITP
jgi:hypothetical protein